MSQYATGITVVSTVVDGRRHGLTVNSFASLSLQPLLAMFGCALDAALHEPLSRSGTWAVSVLAADQQPAAAYFATRERPGPAGTDQFDGWPCRPGPVTGAPLLDGALAWMELRTWATYAGGDHTIVVGEVVSMEVGPERPPLLYFRSDYRA
ncbi:MAG: flavin reductase [Frankiaceae bacterium]|jgi:flavin reductase (DIM6/NTAB) family NADH-FMN oxidoreductase RutF|nr:flavin reductase [Frankiaceae bacterium]